MKIISGDLEFLENDNIDDFDKILSLKVYMKKRDTICSILQTLHLHQINFLLTNPTTGMKKIPLNH